MTSNYSCVFLFFLHRGIPYVSKNRITRMSAIAEKCASREYDIICLQEVWSVEDFKVIKAKVQEILPYSHYFYRYCTLNI